MAYVALSGAGGLNRMDSRFLTPGQHGQVADLTGAHTRARQIRVLVRSGIRHTLNAAGWPVVTWAAVEGQPAKQEDAGEWRINAPTRKRSASS